jgi:hypothetical protein
MRYWSARNRLSITHKTIPSSAVVHKYRIFRIWIILHRAAPTLIVVLLWMRLFPQLLHVNALES